MSKEFKYLKENKELSEWGCLVPTPIVERPEIEDKKFYGTSKSINKTVEGVFMLSAFTEEIYKYEQQLSSHIPVSEEFYKRYPDGWIGTEKDFELMAIAHKCSEGLWYKDRLNEPFEISEFIDDEARVWIGENAYGGNGYGYIRRNDLRIVAYPLERDNEDGENIIEPAANQSSEPVASHSCAVGNSIEQGKVLIDEVRHDMFYISKLIPLAEKELERIYEVVGHQPVILCRLVQKVKLLLNSEQEVQECDTSKAT